MARSSDRPGPFLASSHLSGLLVLTARLVQEQVAIRLSPLGISYAQAAVLVCLYRSATGVLPQSDLIESLAVSRASGTLVLTQLQALGLIGRTPDPGDARRLVIRLTDAGRDLELPVHGAFEEVESVIRRSLHPAEVAAAFDTTRRMLVDVRRHRRSRT
ncbi:MAG TPA: MarR family transcriptional regulator [Candidatus Eisenbacteria bacterium]|nr:MarR family transcriptional regulator [Candidatus Eisenbacteria bacterium]